VHKEEALAARAVMPRRRDASAAMPRRRHAALLLLPLRAAAETPYAKTPYQQWEEDTYYPHSRAGPCDLGVPSCGGAFTPSMRLVSISQ